MENITIESHVDFNYARAGQDVRYAIDGSKLMSFGWKPLANFDIELKKIVEATNQDSFFYE